MAEDQHACTAWVGRECMIRGDIGGTERTPTKYKAELQRSA